MKFIVTKTIWAFLFFFSIKCLAFHPETTHAGITETAAYSGELHKWLKNKFQLENGIWESLRLHPKTLPRVRRWFFVQDVFRLNPANGYAPDKNLDNRAIGWLAAGSVLEAIPSSRVRHHFFNPSTEKGLDQKKEYPSLSTKVRFWDYLYGSGSFAGFLTGANFDLKGKSAIKWAVSKKNQYSLNEHLRHRYLAQVSKSQKVRDHHLSMALISMGALAHLLQKMACPAYVRNDFVHSHLTKGNIIGGTPFARYVARHYGKSGIPQDKETTPPAFTRFRDFFKNKNKTGLAQITSENYYSPGTLPAIKKIRKLTTPNAEKKNNRGKDDMGSAASTVSAKIFQSLKPDDAFYYNRPSKTNGLSTIKLFAYGKTPQGKKKIWLDRRVYRDYAEEILPRAVNYTRGLFSFLTRGSILMENKENNLHLLNKGVPLKKGTLEVFAEKKDKTRNLIHKETIEKTIKTGTTILSIPTEKIPSDTVLVVAVFKGKDLNDEPVIADGVIADGVWQGASTQE